MTADSASPKLLTPKQVAARLSLSHATTHQYVTALYRHFGVRSRAQLLVHVL